MGYKNPNAPATDRQVQWVHGLWKEAGTRGVQGQILQQCRAKGVDAGMWGELLLRGQGVDGAGRAYTMHEVGTIIGECLEVMPDKKPKGPRKTTNKPPTTYTTDCDNCGTPIHMNTPPKNDEVTLCTQCRAKGQQPVELPPNTPTVEEVAQTFIDSPKPYLMFIVPLAETIDQEKFGAVAELVTMFLNSKTTLKIDGDIEAIVTKQPAGEEEVGHEPPF